MPPNRDAEEAVHPSKLGSGEDMTIIHEMSEERGGFKRCSRQPSYTGMTFWEDSRGGSIVLTFPESPHKTRHCNYIETKTPFYRKPQNASR